jgi:hypothetical protein
MCATACEAYGSHGALVNARSSSAGGRRCSDHEPCSICAAVRLPHAKSWGALRSSASDPDLGSFHLSITQTSGQWRESRTSTALRAYPSALMQTCT